MEGLNTASIVIGVAAALGGAFITMLVTHFRLTTRMEKNHAEAIHLITNIVETIESIATAQEKVNQQIVESLSGINQNIQAMQNFLIQNEGTHDLIVEKMTNSFDGLITRIDASTQESREAIKSIRAEMSNKLEGAEARIRGDINKR